MLKQTLLTAVLLILFAFTATMGQQTATNSKPAAQAKQTKTFVNSRENLSEDLNRRFVEFSFNYPATWELKPRSPKGTAFAEVQYQPKNAALNHEYVSVGSFRHNCPRLENQFVVDNITALMNRIADNILSEILTKIQKSPVRRIKIGKYDALSMGFQGVETQSKKNLRMWGRLIFIPGVTRVRENLHGVSIVVLASQLAPGIKGLADVGVKGNAPIVLKSFQFEPKEASNINVPAAPVITKMEIGSELQRVGLEEILTPKNSFRRGERIITQLEVVNVPQNTKIKVRWVAEQAVDGVQKVIREDESPIENAMLCGGKRSQNDYGKYTEEIAAGNYFYEVYLDGKLIKSLPFVLEK